MSSIPPEPTQLIYTDNPGALPAEYEVPPGQYVRLSSIVARFNGAAAGGAFYPALSVYSQDERLMGRFHPEQRLAVGDTGMVTYAPFLRRRLSTATIAVVGALLTRPIADPLAIASSTTPTVLTWATVVFDTGGFFSAGQPTRLTAPSDGIYIVAGSGSFVNNPTGDRHCSIIVSTGVNSAVTASPAPASFFWAGTVVAVHEFAAGDFAELRVAQDSGGNLNTAGMQFSMYAVGTL